MPNTVLNATFDGSTAASLLEGQDPVNFYDGFMGYYSPYESNPANRLVANIDFSGSDWTVATMRFGDASSTNLTRIHDIDDGANRRIDWLSLGFNSEVDLTTTRVRQLTGWDGDMHDVTLGGGGSTWSVALFAKENIVKTGDGFVHSIVTGGKDTIIISDAGADSVKTGDGNAKVTANGFVELIHTGDGKDVVILGEQGAGYVKTGDGNDKIKLAEMPDRGVFIHAGNGTDTLDLSKFKSGVTFNLGDFGTWQNVANPDETPGGPDLGFVSATRVENLIGTNKADTLTGSWDKNKLVGKNGNDTLDGGDDKDVLIAGGGNDTLIGGRGNDTLRGQAGKDTFVFGADSGTDRVLDYVDGADNLRIADHSGGFGSLDISKVGKDMHIVHDGGTIILVGDGGANLTASDFDLV